MASKTWQLCCLSRLRPEDDIVRNLSGETSVEELLPIHGLSRATHLLADLEKHVRSKMDDARKNFPIETEAQLLALIRLQG